MKRLTSAYKQVKIGDPLEKGNLCGPLHTTAAVESYKAAIAEAATLVRSFRNILNLLLVCIAFIQPEPESYSS